MPRKDRRFTGDDLRRLYCKNLDATQRHLFDITTCDWSDYTTVEKFRRIFEAMENSGLLDDIVRYMPGGNYVSLALDVIRGLIYNPGSLPGLDFFPVIDIEKMIQDAKDEREREIESLLGIEINGS